MSAAEGQRTLNTLTNMSDFHGVWSADFALESLYEGLKMLRGDFPSTLFMVDGAAGLLLASSSGGDVPISVSSTSDSNIKATLTLTLTLSNIKAAHAQTVSQNEGSLKVRSGILRGNTIVGVADTTALSLRLDMLNFLAFPRHLLYATFDEAADLAFAALCLASVGLAVFALSVLSKPWNEQVVTVTRPVVEGARDRGELETLFERKHKHEEALLAQAGALLDALELRLLSAEIGRHMESYDGSVDNIECEAGDDGSGVQQTGKLKGKLVDADVMKQGGGVKQGGACDLTSDEAGHGGHDDAIRDAVHEQVGELALS